MARRTVRLTVVLSNELAGFLRDFAQEKNVTVDDLFSRSIIAMKHFKEQRALGRNHMGFVKDRTKLDAELLLFG